MADHTAIEWTDATWNPITGCSVVSPGCTNCYAMKLAGTRLKHHPSRIGLTSDSRAGPVWNGEVRLNESMLLDPLRWRRPRRIFVCAHGDLFHESVPDAWIDQVFAVMALSPQHTFQVLTKRADRMRAYLTAEGVDRRIIQQAFRIDCEAGAWFSADLQIGQIPFLPLENVWLGVSTEDQARADERVRELLLTPAAVRWISAEPLLGSIDLFLAGMKINGKLNVATGERAFINWVVAGGESGAKARPMHPDWARSLRDQCAKAGVPFFFKQWGEWGPTHRDNGRGIPHEGYVHPEGKTAKWPRPPHFGEYGPRWLEEHGFAHMSRLGKKAAGRLLDGVEHNAMPEGRS